MLGSERLVARCFVMSGSESIIREKKPLSRIGRRVIVVPSGVKVIMKDNCLTATGPK